MASSEQDVGLDFHRAFQAIDTDHSGEITIDELQNYCRKMNYQETFVQKWLTLFDEDKNGRITYDEYCNALGLMPKKEVVAKHKAQQKAKKTGKPGGAKPARAEKVVKRRKEQDETTETTETVVASTAGKTSAATAAADAPAPVPAPSPAPAPPPAPAAAPALKRSRQRQRNQPISGTGLMHHSRARMFQRKALYRLAKKSANDKVPKKRNPATGAGRSQATDKPIGGDKNGATRRVAARRSPRALPTEVKPRSLRRRPKRSFSEHKRRLRPSIKPGSVLILLAGRHRGKRVVFLNQLPSGLLLVTGPLRVNGCPLRRVGQSYVMATRTRLGLDEIRVPDRVNDQYFKRTKRLAKKLSEGGADLFARQPAAYQLTQERKEDQKTVDAQVMSAISAREDKRLLLGYLSSLFCLKSGQKPHEMIF